MFALTCHQALVQWMYVGPDGDNATTIAATHYWCFEQAKSDVMVTCMQCEEMLSAYLHM